jgi:hypothetical protein
MQNMQTKHATRDFCKLENRKIKLAINWLREARTTRARHCALKNVRRRNQNSSRTLRAFDNPQGAKFFRQKRPQEFQGHVF